MYAKYTKLHVLAFGFAFGILGALSMFIVGLFAMGGYGTGYVAMLSSLYIGYSATFLGSIIGAIWGFLDCFVFGIILAALYNCFICKGVCRACGKGACKCGVCAACKAHQSEPKTTEPEEER